MRGHIELVPHEPREVEEIPIAGVKVLPYRGYLTAILSAMLLLAVAGASYAQSELLDNWYRDSPRAENYTAQRGEFDTVFGRAAEDAVPPRLLMLVLQEGAAKRVSPERLLAALRAEEQRLSTALQLLKSADLLPTQSASRENAMRQLSVAQTAGVGPEVIGALLPQAEDLEAGLAVLSALAQFPPIRPLSDETLIQLGTALLGSQLTPENYASLSSAYLRGTLGSLPPESVARIIVDVLESGGGLIQIDRELRRRGPRR